MKKKGSQSGKSPSHGMVCTGETYKNVMKMTFAKGSGEAGRMGCGLLLRCQTVCTTGAANLRPKRPAFHTPSRSLGAADKRRGRSIG